MDNFRTKVVAVTGAGSGIGLAVARLAATRGASLSLCDVNKNALNKITQELKDNGTDVLSQVVDVSDSDAVDNWIAATVKYFGKLDYAANVAGVETEPGKEVETDITDMTNSHWKFVMDINLTGLFYCLRAQLRVMERGGSILNVSSIAGVMTKAGISAYATSKHGVIGLTRTAAKEAGKRAIRVNALTPGFIHTPMYERWIGDASDQGVKDSGKDIPLQRVGTVEDMARIICFALSEEASFTSGAILAADGGVAC